MTSIDLSVINRSWKADLEHLDPVEYLPRLAALFADARIQGRYYVNFAARSYLRQAALYRGWQLRLPGFNPANPPGTSLHEYGLPDREYAFAVDINITEGRGGSWAELHIVAGSYGFHFPFANRKTNPEPWHAQLRPGRGPIPLTKEQAMGKAIEPIGSATRTQGGGAIVGRRGHVYAFGGAPHFGGWAEDQAGPTNRSGRDCITLVWTEDGGGYWLVSDAGAVYSYGNAVWPGNYKPREWDNFPIIGAYRNKKQSNGGLTLVRDDSVALNEYHLPSKG